MVERGAVGAALQSVRLLCMELVHSPRAQCVQAITTEMRLFDKEVVQELQQFLIFPLRTVLAQCAGSKSLPQQLLIETCQALDVLVNKSQLQQPAVFMDLFSLLSDLLYCNSSDAMAQRCLSEEEKMAVIQTLDSLMQNSQLEVLHEIYVPTNLARLGGLVSQLIGVVSDTTTSRNLRMQAMDVLLVLVKKRTYSKN